VIVVCLQQSTIGNTTGTKVKLALRIAFYCLRNGQMLPYTCSIMIDIVVVFNYLEQNK